MSNLLAVRDIVIIKFPCQNPQGREQEGIRPGLIVGFPQKIGIPRFPLVFVAPLTTDRNQSYQTFPDSNGIKNENPFTKENFDILI